MGEGTREPLDYGVVRNKETGHTASVWVQGTTISYIFTQYCGSSDSYDKMNYEVVYRGPQSGYTGPKPASCYTYAQEYR